MCVYVYIMVSDLRPCSYIQSTRLGIAIYTSSKSQVPMLQLIIIG